MSFPPKPPPQQTGLPLVPDNAAIAEQLCRIEHKLDLLVSYFAEKDGTFQLRPMNEGFDPLSLVPVEYYMDLLRRHVIRKASYGTNLIPPSMALFNTPQVGNTSNGNGSEDGNVG